MFIFIITNILHKFLHYLNQVFDNYASLLKDMNEALLNCQQEKDT